MPVSVTLLTESGERVPVEHGVPPSALLPPGPVYKLPVVRGWTSTRHALQCSATLVFTHSANAEVNALASALAGHTIQGEACLVCEGEPRPDPGSPSSPQGPGGAQDAAGTPPEQPPLCAEALLAQLLGSRRAQLSCTLPVSVPHHQRRHHRHTPQHAPRHTPHPASAPRSEPAAAGLLAASPPPSITTALSSSLGRPSDPATRTHTSAGGQAWAAPFSSGQAGSVGSNGSTPLGCSPTGSSPARHSGPAVHRAIHAILSARNAPQQDTHPPTPPSHHHLHSVHGVQCRGAVAAAAAAAAGSCSGCTTPQGRRSVEVELHKAQGGREQGGREQGGRERSAPSAVGSPACASQQPQQQAQQRAQQQAHIPGPLEQEGPGAPSGAAARLAPGCGVVHTAAPAAAAGAPPGARGAAAQLLGSAGVPALRTQGAPAAEVAAVDVAEGCGAPVPPTAAVCWGELPGDVVAAVAMQLPPRAAQAAAMAGVCHAWRAAVLGHTPALQRLTFFLDLRKPLLRAAAHGGASGAGSGAGSSSRAAAGRASMDRAGGAVSGVSSAAASRRPPACAAEGGRCGTGRAGGSAPCSPRAGSARPHSAPSGGGGPGGAAEQGPGAAALAVARQYEAGAFVLQPRKSTPEQGCVALPGGPLQAVLQQQTAARRLPRLLLDSARAGSPTAQLVLAQLLEGLGDDSGAMRWWRRLSKAGDPMGMFKLGMAHYDGSHGAPADTDTTHMWLGRVVRAALRTDNLAALPLDNADGLSRAGAAARPPAAAGQAPCGRAARAGRRSGEGDGRGAGADAGGGAEGAAGGPGGVARTARALQEQIRALPGPLLRMLSSASLVLGYLEFDGLAGRSAWGMGDRSEAVRMFRLAELCGVDEASTVLGWLYNTGQYG